MADLVEVVSYHVDIERNLAEFLAVKARDTVNGPSPAAGPGAGRGGEWPEAACRKV